MNGLNQKNKNSMKTINFDSKYLSNIEHKELTIEDRVKIINEVFNKKFDIKKPQHVDFNLFLRELNISATISDNQSFMTSIRRNLAESLLQKYHKLLDLNKKHIPEFKNLTKGEFRNLIEIHEFSESAKNGYFIDDDGVGYLATSTQRSKHQVEPSDFEYQPETIDMIKYTHVLWFNK